MARPTKYNSEILEKAIHYLEEYKQYGDSVPSIEGLSDVLSVGRQAIYAWAEKDEEFSHTLEAIKSKQARSLINGGLEGDFTASIVKLMLYNHGYSEKQDMNLSGGVKVDNEFRIVDIDDTKEA